MHKNQKGFAHLESLLILIVVLLIAFIGWFVWHTKQQADKSLDSASSANFGSISKKKNAAASNPTTLKTKPGQAGSQSQSLVSYASPSSSDGQEVTSASDVDKLSGAPDNFKDFVKDKINKNGGKPAPCGNAYGIFVSKIYKDSFALGAESSNCHKTDKLWAMVSNQWQEIGSTDQEFDCGILEQYKVPSAIVSQCVKNGQTVDNTQS